MSATTESNAGRVGGIVASLREAGDLLVAADRIGLLSHTRPDGDAIGSVLALGSALRGIGKEVVLLNEDGMPENLEFLPGHEEVRTPGDFPDGVKVDVLVILDTGSRYRAGEIALSTFRGWKKEINMDHHASNPGYGDLNVIDTASPATGQIVYQLIREMDWPLDEVARDALFVAISTDTGSFRFPATTAETYRIVADLVDAGADVGHLSQMLYESYPLRRLELLRELMRDMEIREQGRLAFFKLPLSLSERLQLQGSDTEGLIDLIRSIDSVQVAVLFEELKDGKIRISARSKTAALDVGAICTSFGGGGHKLAAGTRMKGPLDKAVERFTQTICDKFQTIH
jgi:phosphoesterase RecJ-like protein